MKKIFFIVPCYNEENNIAPFYDNLYESFNDKNYDVEIVFINDGSTDDSMAELKKLLKLNCFSIKIINFSRNFGKEAGIYAGLKNCTGDYAVLIDADMQQPPMLVLTMLDIIENNCDVDIVTYYQNDRKEGTLLSSLKNCFYKFIKTISGLDFKNGASDFRLFTRQVVESILQFSEHNRFSKGIFAWIGYNTFYIPYVPQKRLHGQSSWNMKSLFKYAFSGIKSFAKQPMTIIYKFGFMTIFVSALLSIIMLLKHVEPIYFMFSLVLFMFGLTFLLLAYVSDFVFNNYQESLNRPLYIAKEVLTNEKNN